MEAGDAEVNEEELLGKEEGQYILAIIFNGFYRLNIRVMVKITCFGSTHS